MYTLKEIEEGIARRQVEINALNEQAEDLTEHDTPPIDQHLLQLNQRWVGIRSRVENFKPTNGVTLQTNGTPAVKLSPATSKKYEYAVINKNRKNLSQPTVTQEISIDGDASPGSVKRDMSLPLASPDTPNNNNVLFVTSPATPAADSLTSTPHSNKSTDEPSAKRYIVETDLDEVVTATSASNVSAAFYDSGSDEEKQDEYRQLLSRVGILEQQLKTSGIEIDQYTHENFTSSQHLLAVSRLLFAFVI